MQSVTENAGANNTFNFPIKVSVVISSDGEKPYIEIRRYISDFNQIKNIIESAFNDKPVLVLPQFRDKMNAIAVLIEKGIMYKKENNFFFNI